MKQTRGKQDKVRTFEVDDPVWAWVYSGKQEWSPGVVVEKCGPWNYKVQMDKNVVKQHVDQLRFRYSKLFEGATSDDFVITFPSLPEQEATETSARYSKQNEMSSW